MSGFIVIFTPFWATHATDRAAAFSPERFEAYVCCTLAASVFHPSLIGTRFPTASDTAPSFVLTTEPARWSAASPQ